MGYLTVITIHNDNLEVLRKDPNFGKNLVEAIHSSFKKEGVLVPSAAGNVSCIGATIITQFHTSEDAMLHFKSGRVLGLG
jgi:hypothetical protein